MNVRIVYVDGSEEIIENREAKPALGYLSKTYRNKNIKQNLELEQAQGNPMSYKSSISQPIPKYWKATINEPEPGRNYTKTGFVGVVATDVMSACTAILKERPNAIIVSVVHEGPVNIMAI